jgi:hypothetical protein
VLRWWYEIRLGPHPVHGGFDIFRNVLGKNMNASKFSKGPSSSPMFILGMSLGRMINGMGELSKGLIGTRAIGVFVVVADMTNGVHIKDNLTASLVYPSIVPGEDWGGRGMEK